MANLVTHICTHQLQSGRLHFDANGVLSACLVCDQCDSITRELSEQTAEVRKLTCGSYNRGRGCDAQLARRLRLRSHRASGQRHATPWLGNRKKVLAMLGYKFLLEIEGLDHPVWQHGYGNTEAECRRDAEARIDHTYGAKAITYWAQRPLDDAELLPPRDAPVQEPTGPGPLPAKDELYWHMEVDAWLAQLSEIRGLPETSTDDLT